MTDEKKTKKKDDSIYTSYYLTDDLIIEIVFDYYFQPEIQFAVYDRISKEVSYHPQLPLANGKYLRPLQLDVIKEGKLLLPSAAHSYISEEGLIEEIEAFVSTYLDLPHPFYLKLVSHYILLTWVYDKLTVVPYLRALGDYGSGKTRFAQVVGSLSYKPLFLAGATSDAFIFRMIELFKGTLIINELERVNTDLQSQIVNILNNGYEKGLYIGKVEGDKNKVPKTFDVFSPKIITTRVKFKDLALESRILSVPMRPTKRKDIPTLIDSIFWDSARDIRNKLLMYRFNNLFAIEFENKEVKLEKVEPRLRQTLLPIFYVIQNQEVEDAFVSYALEFQGQIVADRSFEMEAILAEKLVELLEENEKITVKDVADELNKELSDKEQVTSKRAGKIIRGFGFNTKRIQGVYNIIPNEQALDYIKDRFGLTIEQSEESPLPPPNPPTDSASQGDLVDEVDIDKPVEQMTTEEVESVFKEQE